MSVISSARTKLEDGYLSKFRRFSRNAWLYLLFVFCYSSSFAVFLVVLGLYLLSMGYDESLVGSIELTAMILGAAICLPGGLLTDRVGGKYTLLGAAGLVALGRIGLVLTADSRVMILAAIPLGAGIAINWIGGDVLLAGASTEKDRPLLFSIRFATFSIALVLGSIFGGILPGMFGALMQVEGTSPQAYHLTLVIAAGISILGIVPLLFASDVRYATSRRKSAGLLGYRMKQPTLIAKLLLPQAFNSMSVAAIFPFLSIFFRYRLSATVAQAGVIIAMASIVATIAALVAPTLADKVGKVRATAYLQLAGLPFLLIAGYTSSLEAASVAFWLYRGLVASSFPIMVTFVMQIVDAEERGRASAVANLFWNGGWAISAWGAGSIMAAGHYSAAYLFSALCLVVGAVSWYSLFRKDEIAPSVIKEEEQLR